jgi:phosphoribosylformylglycinamidine synthase
MTAPRPSRIEIGLKTHVTDARGQGVAAGLAAHLGLPAQAVATRDVFTFDVALSGAELERVRREFTDAVIQDSASPRLEPAEPFQWLVLVGFKPGVTDNVGRTAKSALADILGRKLGEDESVHTATAYLLTAAPGQRALTREEAHRVGAELLANELIETVQAIDWAEWQAGKPEVAAPKVKNTAKVEARRMDLTGSDEGLMTISRKGTLALSLEEMQAIRDHFKAAAADPRRSSLGLDARPTDIELETLAQTWSEHCKHKIFAAEIHYREGGPNGPTRVIDNLFKSRVKAATAEVGKRIDWLVSVFDDNAGVVSFNDRLNVVFKVETHNSPSALEPYGGAMTGIVGCNRDPMGTGMGAELLINVWGYCFASPFTPAGRVPAGVMHPRRLRDGVHRGVIDGGNQSGIPYGTGWEFFDERYLAKPMVYCGTVGLLPKTLPDGRPAHQKRALPGDRIVMTGGRIGKDGIHGATFSSEELHKDSPVQAVQIGDPITQKKMSDFLIEARDLGLYRAITDDGAGGLSSSVGEMAGGPGGATVDLALAPLKYAGLQPWEIWLSEAQERMTLAVPPENMAALRELAARRDVEMTDLGVFNDTGFLHLKYGAETVGLLSMEFMHEGCPRLTLEAEWTPPVFDAPPALPGDGKLGATLAGLLGRLNVASKEAKSRRYDHEVKGRTVLKPWVGVARDVPSDATIFLAEYDGQEGIVLSKGFNSHYSDLDCRAMIGAAMDEAIRRILAVGGRLDRIAALDNFCWPDPVVSPETPDGKQKLAQLVRANDALYETCVTLGVPLISGKDSMKNDSRRGGKKISIPPSVLISAIGKIDDVRRAVTLEAKAAGDLVYVIGQTRAELGASELAWMLSDAEVAAGRRDADAAPAIGGRVPELRLNEALPVYKAVEKIAAAGLARSLHSPTLGGLAVGLALVAMGGELGIEAELEAIPTAEGMRKVEALFSESTGRFIATVAPEKAVAFEAALAGVPMAKIGIVTPAPRLVVKDKNGRAVIDEDVLDLKKTWKAPLAAL